MVRPEKPSCATIRTPAIVTSLDLSIVVPAFNEEKLLPATLRSIGEAAAVFTALGWEHEVAVCDNNSSDQTAAIGDATSRQYRDGDRVHHLWHE